MSNKENTFLALSFGELCQRSHRPCSVITQEAVVELKHKRETQQKLTKNLASSHGVELSLPLCLHWDRKVVGFLLVLVTAPLLYLVSRRVLGKPKREKRRSRRKQSYHSDSCDDSSTSAMTASKDGVPLRAVSVTSNVRRRSYTPTKKLPSSSNSVGSVASMSTTYTNCDVGEIDEHGVMVPASSRTLHSSSRTSKMTHGTSPGTALETSSFHQQVETLLQSLIVSDSEDDDTDDDSLAHYDTGLADMEDHDDAVVVHERAHRCESDYPSTVAASKMTPDGRRHKGGRRLFLRTRRKEKEDDLVEGQKRSSSKRTLPKLVTLPSFKSRDQSGTNKNKALPKEKAISALIKASTDRHLSRRERDGTHRRSIEQTTNMVAFTENCPRDLVATSSDRRLSTSRRKHDLGHRSSSGQFSSAQMAKQRFLEAAAAALDMEDAPSSSSNHHDDLSSQRLFRRTIESFETDEYEEDFAHSGASSYGITKYFHSSPGTRHYEEASHQSRRYLTSKWNIDQSGEGMGDMDSSSVDSNERVGQRRLEIARSWDSELTFKTDTDVNQLSHPLLDFDDEVSVISTISNSTEDQTVITNIDMVERLCTTDAHRRKLKKARLVVRVVLGPDRKDYKTSKACFQAIDMITDLQEDIRQAVVEKSKYEQTWTDLKTLWHQLWRAGSAACMVFPPLPTDPEDVDSYDYALLLLCKIFCTLYPELTPNFKTTTFASDIENLGDSGEGHTLLLGTVNGVKVSMPLRFVDADPIKRTRLTPYKHDQRYPLSLQDAFRVVRAILGPSHKRVSGQDCLQAIQAYGLWKIEFRRLSEDLDMRRTRIVELGTALHQIGELLPNVVATAKKTGDSNLLHDISSHIDKRLSVHATMDPQQASIVNLSEYVHQLLGDNKRKESQ